MRPAALVLQKDLRVLVRSPLLLGVLIAYPLLVAGLVGLVAGYGSSKPRVALVDEDHLPQVVSVGGHQFRIQDAIDEVGKNVHLVRMDPVAARRALATGRVVATLTVPPGFLADLKSGLHAPSLVYQVTSGGISSPAAERLRADRFEVRATDHHRRTGGVRWPNLRRPRPGAHAKAAAADAARPTARPDRRVRAHRRYRAGADGEPARRDREPDRARTGARGFAELAALCAGAVLRARADDHLSGAAARRRRDRE